MRVRARAVMPRVFEKGPYRLEMGLARLAPSEWLWVSEHHADELAHKRRLLAAGADIARRLPEGEAAIAETAALVDAYLATHHPDLGLPAEADPLLRVGLSVQEDFCWLQASPEGYRLVAAFVAFPARWRLADKIGRPLGAIHAPVPGFAERLLAPTERIFESLAVDRPVQRANWSLVDDPDLHQPAAKDRWRRVELDPEDAGARLHLRVERQTLRRLPTTGAVLFTIHTLMAPLAEIAAAPTAAAALRARLREMPAAMRDYKNLATAHTALDTWLARRAGEA
ncbi:MAG: heme-dependent oxidative N-demethylase family protein [Alphaproteobacteria bacterium]